MCNLERGGGKSQAGVEERLLFPPPPPLRSSGVALARLPGTVLRRERESNLALKVFAKLLPPACSLISFVCLSVVYRS